MSRTLRSVRRRATVRKGRDGVAAIEFALVGLPFFFFMFALLELGLIFTINSVVDVAASQTGRLIRTGQAFNTGMTKQQFKAEFCSRMSIFEGDCAERASIDVRVLPRFAGATPPDPATGETFNEGMTEYTPGASSTLMLVRVWYRQPVLVPFAAPDLPKKRGYTLISASTAFRNEPF